MGLEVCERQGPRRTYPQNWAAYNAAQTTEKDQFLVFLHAVCQTIQQPTQKKGRPRIPYQDMMFAVCFKIYTGLSGRRFMTDLRTAKEHGFIQAVPHFNSLFNCLEDAAITPILQDMIVETARPMSILETDFAMDASGFSTRNYTRWFDYKYGKRTLKEWVKVHIMCGVKTHIVTAAEIGEKATHDSKMLHPLVAKTAYNFDIREVSADKAYSNREAHRIINSYGATPYIAFRQNTRMPAMKNGGMKKDIWAKMYHLFAFHQEEFAEHYHKRSNVESVFSMVKAKFGAAIRSKTDVAQRNEVLCKFICHNICVLIHEMHELGVYPEFWKTRL